VGREEEEEEEEEQAEEWVGSSGLRQGRAGHLLREPLPDRMEEGRKQLGVSSQ
jgi:hypothetical protein